MYQKTLSFYIVMMYRNFSSFTSKKLQEAGLNFGLLFFIIYIVERHIKYTKKIKLNARRHNVKFRSIQII